MTTPIEIAASEILECDIDEINKEPYDHYGLDVFSNRNEEYAIGLESETDEAVKSYIRDSLWTFKAEMILSHSKAGSSPKIIKALQDANEIIYCMIEDIDEFVRDVVNADGRGAFLSSYDGEEHEIDINGITFVAYRIN
jgi:hypothetical protein